MTYSILKTNFYKNPFIGLYLRTNDRHTFMAKNAPARIRAQAQDALKTELVEFYVNQSPLIGLFCVMNNHGAILAANSEREEKNLLKKHGYDVHVLKTSLTPGNVLLFNNKIGLASPQLPPAELKPIGETLGIPMHQLHLSGMHTIGATNVVTDKGIFAYNDVTEVEFKQMEKLFGIHGTNGTSNNGVPFNSFGVVANNHGALAGDLTSGFEMQRIYEALSGE
ncbi:translation initiation factor IF-6 [Candidatus Micrarchaeota archaeon]|nr:translation initiation factor IF-6 [Candidatus Micrarchaeota archaeon]